MKRALLILILLALFSISVSSQTIHLDPELYFIVDDNAIGSDQLLRDSIIARVDEVIDLDTAVTSFEVVDDSQVTRTKLQRAVGVVIHKGEVMVITGDATPLPGNIQPVSSQIIQILTNDFGITPQQLASSALITDELTDLIQLPPSEVVFVLSNNPELSDDMVLRMLVGEMENHNEQDPAPSYYFDIKPSSFRTDAQVGMADLATQITVVINQGKAIIIIDDNAPADQVTKATDIASMLTVSLGVPSSTILSSTVASDDLTKAVPAPDAQIRFPEVHFVIDEPRTQFDTVLFQDLTDILRFQSQYDLAPINYYMDAEFPASELDYRVTVFLAAGDIHVITGENSPLYQSFNAQELYDILVYDFGLAPQQHSSADITTDNFTESLVESVIVPPGGVHNPELLFVIDDDPDYADQAMLNFILEELGPALDLDNRVNNYALRVNSNVTKAELDYRVTVFVYKGEVLVIVGAHSPPSHLALLENLVGALWDIFEIEAQVAYSGEIIFDDLRQEVKLFSQGDNTFNLDITLDQDLDTAVFFAAGTNGNTSGSVTLSHFNLSGDDEYDLSLPSINIEEVEGEVELFNGAFEQMYLDIYGDKLSSWDAEGDSLFKTYTFRASDGTLDAPSGELNLTVRIDSLENVSRPITIPLTLNSVDVGRIYIDPTDLLAGLVDVRELSLKGRVFRALGDIQQQGLVTAFGNLGTFTAPIVNGHYFITILHEAVGELITYEVSHVEAYNSTYPPEVEPPIALDHDLVINQTQRGEYVNLVDVPRQLQFPHFADEDMDGVPDQIDLCPGTVTEQSYNSITAQVVEDEDFIFSDNGTVLQINDSVAQFQAGLSSNDLDNLLASSTHYTQREINETTTVALSTPVHQHLFFERDGPNGFVSNLSIFQGENEQDEESEFLHAKDGEILFEYELFFEDGLESDVENDVLEMLVGTQFQMLGQTAYIKAAELSGNQLALALVSAPIVDSLALTDSPSYVINGTGYDITLVEIIEDILVAGNSSAISYIAVLEVNGEEITLIKHGTYGLPDGSTLQVLDIDPSKPEPVTFALDSHEIRFADTYDNQNFDGQVSVDGEQIEDALVKLSGNLVGSVFELGSINYRLTADTPLGDLYIKRQTGLRENLDEPQGMLTNNWNIEFTGDSQIIFHLHGGAVQPPIGYYVSVTGYDYEVQETFTTTTFAVDAFGCSCAQKNCAAEGLGCIEDMGQAVCAPTCFDGFKNGAEEGPDCGAVCGVGCGPNVCETPLQCIGTAPGFCSANYTTTDNCQQCGCPSNLLCIGTGSCSGSLPPHCFNNILDGDERGIDCGGSCFGLCPGDECNAADTCLPPQPAYCNGNFEVELQCGTCGCPDGFTCNPDGRCYPPDVPPDVHCNNGILDGDERTIDCGGSCGGVCPGDQCFDLDQCLGTQPLFCDANATVQSSCGQCGCPSGFSCTAEGTCEQTLSLTGTKCINTEFFTFQGGQTCAQLMNDSSWRTELAAEYVNMRLVGNLATWMGKKHYQKKIDRILKKTKLCFREADMGCVLGEYQCPLDDYAEEVKPELANAVRGRLKSESRKRIPGFFKNWPFNLHARVKVDFTNLPIESNYECSDLTVTTTTVNENGETVPNTCEAVQYNGNSDGKIDLLVMGEGFTPGPIGDDYFRDVVDMVLDYDGVRTDTPFEGLFSREPWQSRKQNFNIWSMRAPDEIRYARDVFLPVTGPVPSVGDVLNNSNLCPQRDFIVLVTPKPFRSHCYLGYPGPCFVSLMNEPYPGRLFAHELGHGIGVLTDEYYEPVEISSTGIFSIPELLIAKARTGPNCQPSTADAQAAWGSLVGGEVGYFSTCGGICSQSCGTFIRPTKNSIMNNQDYQLGEAQLKPDGSLDRSRLGPPFEPWHAVNERQIASILDNPQINPTNARLAVEGKGLASTRY